MTLRYRNEAEDFEAHFWLENPDADRNHTRESVAGVVLWWVMMGFGIFVGILAEFLFASILFAVFLLNSFRGFVGIRRRYRGAIRHQCKQIRETAIELEVSDGGLLERSDGIESLAPWESVVGYRENGKLIVIRLSNGLLAIVPKRFLEPEEEAFLLHELGDHGVCRKEGAVSATRPETRRFPS